LGPWQRRLAGRPDWFVPSEFFARRCLRILPPYYAALILWTAIALLVGQGGRTIIQGLGTTPVTLTDVLDHVVLIHNLTPDQWSLNGVFWSLGLEWQWYWLFPAVLILAASRPRLAAITAAGVTIAWLVAAVALIVVTNQTLTELLYWILTRGALPARIFEFTSGVVAARLVVVSRAPMSHSMAGACLGAGVLMATILVWPLFAVYGTTALLAGVGYPIFICIAARTTVSQRILSWRPLAVLGLISYSVYLMHLPVVQATEYLLAGSLRSSAFLLPAGMIAGVLAGAALHLAVEQWAVSRSTWFTYGPSIMRWFSWTDRVYRRHGESFSNQREPGELAIPLGKSL
jgi:peptidoglycan/LPS O-acetylase OafA/YrhL